MVDGYEDEASQEVDVPEIVDDVPKSTARDEGRFGSERYEDDGRRQLSAVLDKIPFVGGLKREASLLRRLVGERRGPRLMVVGPRSVREAVVRALLELREVPSEADVWWRTEGETALWYLADALPPKTSYMEADVVIWLAYENDIARAVSRVSTKERPTKEFMLLVASTAEEMEEVEEAVLYRLGKVRQDLESRLGKKGRSMGVFIALETAKRYAARVPQNGGDRGMNALREALAAVMPEEAAMEAARVLRAHDARSRVADAIIQSSSTLAITVALAPVPLSDIALIAPLQGLMVSTLCYLSGRSLDRRTMAEWLASAGVAGGMGIGFRTIARQVVKLVPGAGSVVAGSIAGAGTLALGRSAKRYFLNRSHRLSMKL